ncbi:unnamed protein product [Adineta steineri]|uniref:glutamine--fructose-6-phosphate transaminase (isomerizing) n=1 Tax=Adineta steineri TaxID=433720 RepID=A0A813QLP9_9BILA|nr:unnamed protein product [Adineta steineri]
MCGIFGYLNYLVKRDRRFIADILMNGLHRLEYRGYDSSGIAFDGDNIEENNNNKRACIVVRQKGKVEELEHAVKSLENIDWNGEFSIHVGIAHTRWATHGEPSAVNSHPQRSDEQNQFVCVHNGIITNYKDIKQYLINKNYIFESETDTEVVIKLVKYLYDKHKNENIGFQKLIEMACSQLEGAFALLFKSIHYPGQLCATRRGSPMVIGVKCADAFGSNHIPVMFSKDLRGVFSPPLLITDQATTDLTVAGNDRSIEYYFASDASAIIEHTNQVIFMEDDDLAVVNNVLARGGQPVLICNDDDEELIKIAPRYITVPCTVDCLQGILCVVPMQLLSFHIAVLRGYDVDCPRNLAKSVTVA